MARKPATDTSNETPVTATAETVETPATDAAPAATDAAKPAPGPAAPAAPASRFYVYSTLANSQKYIDWKPGGGDMKIATRFVLIKGGTGVANDRIVTPLGVVTEVSAEDVALLERNPAFINHARRGYVTIERKRIDPEKVAADMSRNDPSSPKTPADYSAAPANAAKPREDA